MDKLKNNKGITLIALIMTIVLLLVLAIISIISLTGENGILKQSINAKKKYMFAQDKEQLDLIVIGVQVGNNGKRPFNAIYDAFKGATQVVAEIIEPNPKPELEEQNKYSWIGLKTVNNNEFVYDFRDGEIKEYENSEFSNQYKVTYYANGGKFSNGEDEKSVEDIKYREELTLIIEEDLPQRAGYTFNGWNTQTDGSGVDYSSGSTCNINDDLTLYAKWIENTYTIEFNSNGGTGTMTSITGVEYAKNQPLTKNAFTKTGYKFDGWNTQANGNGTSYGDGATVKSLTSAANGKVILYAQWDLESYSETISYSGSSKQIKVPATGKYTIELYGAQGGTFDNLVGAAAPGGKGGYIKGTVLLNEGDLLTFWVGGKGGDGSKTAGAAGGFNGGGANNKGRGAGGGGATSVTKSGPSSTEWFIIVGGGRRSCLGG